MDKFGLAAKVLQSFQKEIASISETLTAEQRHDHDKQNALYAKAGEYIETLAQATRKALSAVAHLHPGEEIAKHHVEHVMGEYAWLHATMHRRQEMPPVFSSDRIMRDLQELLQNAPLYDGSMALRAAREVKDVT